jgi:hypothetical protein
VAAAILILMMASKDVMRVMVQLKVTVEPSKMSPKNNIECTPDTDVKLMNCR